MDNVNNFVFTQLILHYHHNKNIPDFSKLKSGIFVLIKKTFTTENKST